MFKIKIHPTFWVYAIILIIQNNYIFFVASMLCIFMHEWAHAKVASSLGYYLDTLSIMPFGAMLSGENSFDDSDGAKIAFAGPLINFALCVCLIALWWISPISYTYTKIIFDASLTLSIFNLLPIFPLDGARIIISTSKNKLKTINRIKTMGIVISGVLAISFLASFFYKPNLSLGIISATIYLANISNSNDETYRLISNNCLSDKNTNTTIQKYTILVHYDLKLIRLLKHLKPDTYTTFEIIDNDLKTVKTLSETDVRGFITKANLQCTIKELLCL